MCAMVAFLMPARFTRCHQNRLLAAGLHQLPTVGFITKILDDIADEDGWAHLGALGANITKLRPEFDPRTHGYKKLSDLIKGYPHAFELQARGTPGGTAVMYARHKQQIK